MFNKKVIYWDYAYWIAIYSIFIITIGIFFAKIIEEIMPKYNENKSKLIIICEIYLQVSIITIGIYILKEYLSIFFKHYFNINKNPEKFATFALASIIFSQQNNLSKKLHHKFL